MSKLIYIASPYTGDEENNTVLQIKTADELRALGFLPYWPLCTHYWHLLYPHKYEYWMQMDYEWIKRSDAVLRLPGESNGADLEVAFAEKNNILVFTSRYELVLHFRNYIQYQKRRLGKWNT